MSEVLQKAKKARLIAPQVELLDARTKNNVLTAMAQALLKNTSVILQANARDINNGRKNNLSAALLDRLTLTQERIKAMSAGLLALTKLPDPNQRILEKIRRPNGLYIEKISVPLGVIALIYEARPNVTADAAGLCFKAGSAVILRGGSAAAASNKAIVNILRQVLRSSNLPADIIQNIETTERRAVTELMSLRQYIDLLIPRGGAGLIKKTVEEAAIPVIETGTGNCHIYVDQSADLRKALKIVINAKTQRPSVCNAAESLLVHQEIAAKFLPKILPALKAQSVVIHGCPQTRKYAAGILKATEEDYFREYLDLEISVKVVRDITEAIAHIKRYGTKHTETILTKNKKNAERFLREIDAAAVLVNTSTRFTDGGEFGFGCELGISTQKLHARGPLGLKEIMSYKYLVRGSGQVRK